MRFSYVLFDIKFQIFVKFRLTKVRSLYIIIMVIYLTNHHSKENVNSSQQNLNTNRNSTIIPQFMTLKQIHATEEIMRIAINGQNHVDSLIGYYRDCIDNFNDERAQWSIYYEACKENVSNRHLLERQLNKINSNNIDLQQSLSALKGDLTYERQKYFQRIEQNQKIKQTLQENRKRLQQLTEMCKPLNTLDHSRAKSAYSVKTNAHETEQKSLFKNEKLSRKEQQSPLTELELRLINLNRDHEHAKSKLQAKIDELKEQLEEIVSEHSSRRQECSQEYGAALEKITDLESKHQNLVSQFFRYRMNGIEEEQRTQQENEVMRLKNLALVQRLKQLQESHSDELTSVENEVKRKNKDFKQKYDEQLRKKEEHLSILKQQHERISQIYLNKLKKLQADLRNTTQRTRAIEQKTKVQVSSLKSQIKILTNRLESVAMNQMRSDLVNNEQESEDDSSVTIEMEELDRINKEVKQLEREIGEKKKEK